MKNLLKLCCYFFILLSTAYSQWIPIDSLRVQDTLGVPLLLGQTVTTRGVVTTFREFGGSLVYFQTRTAGMVGFDTAFCNRVKRGDSIEVTGLVTQFAGLTELSPVSSVTVFDTGKAVSPVVVTTTQIRVGGETYEGRLVKIRNVTAVRTTAGADVTNWTVSGSGTNFRIFANGDSCDVRIYATSNIANQPVMAFPFDVITVCSQFKFTSPFTTGYQLLPRRLDDFSIATGIGNLSNITPDKFTLNQNYPNPFNPNTKISYQINADGFVSLKVYDVLGNEVATLVNKKQNTGTYEVDFSAGGLTSGIYFYKLSTTGGSGNFTETKKMILLK